jgi:putative spermidine/putrescine transport system ATP-binding protein
LRVNLREEIRAIQRSLGITTVFVTHDQEEALAVSDRIAVMSDGVLHQAASPSELYLHPATLFVAQFIGSMNLLPARVSGGMLEAGAFRLLAHGVSDGVATLAVRPEDLEFAPGGVPVALETMTDLGHYQSLRVRAGEHALTVFASREARSERGLRVRRALVYVDGKLAARLEPQPQVV